MPSNYFCGHIIQVGLLTHHHEGNKVDEESPVMDSPSVRVPKQASDRIVVERGYVCVLSKKNLLIEDCRL